MIRHFAEEHDVNSLPKLCEIDELERECIELRQGFAQKMVEIQRTTDEMNSESQRLQELAAAQRETVDRLRLSLLDKDNQIVELMAEQLPEMAVNQLSDDLE